MMQGKYLSYEHKAAVLAVLNCNGRISAGERTKNMIAHAIGRGKHQRDALDTVERQIAKAVDDRCTARDEYMVYCCGHKEDLIDFWQKVELLEDEP